MEGLDVWDLTKHINLTHILQYEKLNFHVKYEALMLFIMRIKVINNCVAYITLSANEGSKSLALCRKFHLFA